MISGLRLKLTSAEISAHCKARAQYHVERAEEKQASLSELREMHAKLLKNYEPSDVAKMSKFGNVSTADQVEVMIGNMDDAIRNHRNKALALSFIGDHLYSEDYDLTEADLVRLEILGRY